MIMSPIIQKQKNYDWYVLLYLYSITQVLEVFSSCITEEEPPSTVSPVNKVEDNSSANMAKLHPLLKDEMGGGEET